MSESTIENLDNELMDAYDEAWLEYQKNRSFFYCWDEYPKMIEDLQRFFI